jgi:hypothetical protein
LENIPVKRVLIAFAILLSATPAFAQTSLLPTLQQIRPEYPTPMSPAQLAEYLNRVAWIHRAEGWGLLRKDAGNRCPAPQGVFVACDILVYAPTAWHFDVIIDAGGASTPAWTDKGPCDPSISGCDMARFVAPIDPSPAPPPPGNEAGSDFNGDLHPDLIWQNDATRQTTMWYMGGAGGTVMQTASWVWSTSVPGWRVAGTGDFNGDGKPDLIWVNDVTRQVVVWYMGGSFGNLRQTAAWMSTTGYPGWHIAAIADFNGDGKPDLVAQNDTTHQVFVVFMGGPQGITVLGSTWISSSGIPAWSVVAARDFNGDGKPDLVWQNDITRQVVVWYMSGVEGNVMQSAAWISTDNVPGWTIVGARDFNNDGHPDLVWQNDTTRQVGVWYLGGAQSNARQGVGWISTSGVPGWTVNVR